MHAVCVLLNRPSGRRSRRMPGWLGRPTAGSWCASGLHQTCLLGCLLPACRSVRSMLVRCLSPRIAGGVHPCQTGAAENARPVHPQVRCRSVLGGRGEGSQLRCRAMQRRNRQPVMGGLGLLCTLSYWHRLRWTLLTCTLTAGTLRLSWLLSRSASSPAVWDTTTAALLAACTRPSRWPMLTSLAHIDLQLRHTSRAWRAMCRALSVVHARSVLRHFLPV